MATETPRRPEEEIHGEPESKPRFGPGSDDAKPAGNPSDPRGDKVASRDSLKAAEEKGSSPSSSSAHHEKIGGGYRHGDKGSGSIRDRFSNGFTNFTGVLKRNKKKTIGGAVAGGVVGVSMFGFSVIQGPLQFIHLAQMLQKYHFSSQYDATDSRYGKIARYMFHKSNDEVYKTNLGYFQNKYADRVANRLKEAGIESEYNERRGFKERTSIDSKFFEGGKMTPDQIKARIDASYPKANAHIQDGKVYIDNNNLKFRQNFSLEYSMARKAGYSRTYSFVNARVMSKRANYVMHPFQKLDRKANDKIDAAYNKWLKDRVKKIGEGKSRFFRFRNDSKKGDTDTDRQNSADVDSATEETDSALKKMRTGTTFKVAGAAGAVVGIGCLAKDLDEGYDGIKEEEVILPAIRLAMDTISSGAQVQAGDDFDPEQLNWLAKQMHGEDSTGTVTHFNQANSLAGEEGKKDKGYPESATLKSIGEGSPFAFANSGAIGTILDGACSTAGTIITGVVGLVSSPVSTLIGAGFGAAFGDDIQRAMIDTISGKAIDPLAKGADFGNIVNYGSRLAANSQASSNGGRPLDTEEEGQLASIQRTQDEQDFNSKSFFARMFDVKDYRSLASRTIDNTSPENGQTLQSMATSIGNLSFLRNIASSILLPKANADSNVYDYGFPEVGFSADELDSDKVENPYKNAQDVIDNILPNNPDYLERAEKCFKVSIDSSTYKVLPATDGSPPIKDVVSDDCRDKNTEWMQVRFYIFDNNIATSAACFEGDEDKCAEMGIGQGAQETSDGGETDPSIKFDMDDLYKSSVDISCANGTKDLGVQDGYHDGQKVEIRVCGVESVPETGDLSTVKGADGKLIVNSRLSAFYVDLIKDAKSAGAGGITAQEGFRTMARQEELKAQYGSGAAEPGYSNHQMGVAVDWGDSMINYLNREPHGLKALVSGEPWHWSPTGN